MYVYFIKQRTAPGLIKIGVSINPLSRLKQLQTGCGHDLEIIHAVWMGGEMAARRLEKGLHDELSIWKYKHGGSEWFKERVIKVIRSRANGDEHRRGMYPCCVEFMDKRIRGAPQEVLAQLESLLK